MDKRKIDERSSNLNPQTNLFNLIVKKIEALTQYLKITESLDSKIYSGDIEEIENLLNERNSLIEMIESIDQEIQELQLNRPKMEANNFLQSHKELIKPIQELLKEIESLDQYCITKLTQKRNEIKSQLSQNHNFYRAIKFYRKPPLCQPRFLDLMK